MTGVLTKRGNLDTGTHTERTPVNTEAEIGVIHLPAKECQGWPAVAGAGRETWNRFSLRKN